MGWISRPKCWPVCRLSIRFRKKRPRPGGVPKKHWPRHPLQATFEAISNQERKAPMPVTLQLARRFLTEVDPRLVWKFAVNFGIKGGLSVERFKRRLRKGIHFPPFLFISIINSCQLRCQGCWVDVAERRQMIERDDLNRLIRNAKKHGNSFFGILGGEPFMHPELLEVLAAHPDCYFQIFTNGQLITPEVAKELRRLGNATPLISIEGSEVVSDQRRGGREVLNKTLAGP